MAAASKGEVIGRLEDLAGRCARELESLDRESGLEEVRVRYLGRKGELAQAMAGLKDLDDAHKPEVGRVANQVKARLNDLLAAKARELEAGKTGAELAGFDPAMPGRRPWQGSWHPITQVLDEICRTFARLGFDVVTGPEVETDFHNFEALNIPADHPARDMQDTLYISEAVVLRTHTSNLQVRTMLAQEPPVAVIAPGKVYRRDSDLTHTPMFHQVEGLLVDEGVSMAELRGTLTHFVRSIFGPGTRVRFRSSFFPFTEPSAEVDISCVMCSGQGTSDGVPCRVCKQTGWIEILGCGMVDPNVFEAVGYDPERYTGWAFGMGAERIAMLKYGIGDIRMYFENDVRFLSQFSQIL
jgi:phenylalanyl-tRNA synthetase alpha chain